MSVTLFMASSVDGFIARKDGSEDFLSDDHWIAFCNVAKAAGCVIMGRGTYDAISSWKGLGFDDVKAKIIVVSKNKRLQIKHGFLNASSPKDALKIAKGLGFKNPILAGGAVLNSSFMRQGLIDSVILRVEPVVVGGGIPIFSGKIPASRLVLKKSKKRNHSILELRFVVV